ncbi:hypothetical protein DFP72DRAFT_1118832 [Ephemerocybe angulata]|uniref:Uncharacterized protein n=1 Tax=Ephemerocybe angulata TaxID=980116 RepID=A0A8H6HZE6_9AGAR|nr:hypothetical protein DFP72DRAFT_1118832 [Tulosesus angulatus]
MGGSAFQSLLGKEAFPRIPPAVYAALKSRMLSRVSELYSFVTVPVEAPEKRDYGDLDLLVAGPKPRAGTHGTDLEGDGDARNVVTISHAVVQEALGAKHAMPMDGFRTSNYAVPVQQGEWKKFGCSLEEEASRSVSPNSEIFYQVDIHVCKDEAEWARINFFHSYGDMGMMLGLITRNIGLRLGEHGLKLPVSQHQPLMLSDSFDEILPFLGLDKGTFDKGFRTKEEVFEWVASVRFFDPRFFRSSGEGITKVKQDRKMYREFVQWVNEHNQKADSDDLDGDPRTSGRQLDINETIMKVQAQALIFFDKKAEHESRTLARQNREKVRKTFCGHNIRDWTELGEHWKGMGGEDGVLRFLEDHDNGGEERLREIAVRVRDQLGLCPTSQHQNQDQGSATFPNPAAEDSQQAQHGIQG